MSVNQTWVAVSGGVDSAVAAALARESGAHVTAVTLDFGLESDAVVAAAGVAAALGIDHRVIDAHRVFEERVVSPFVRGYVEGTTPNPCVMCNEHVKFGMLLDVAREAGVERLLTGHYARVVVTSDGLRIGRAVDPRKDQSYFLYRLGAETLSHVGFPLGGLTKAEVRSRAVSLGLPVAERAESQDVCFLNDTTAGGFVCARVPEAGAAGPIVDPAGRRIGTHRGICHYTVGQRKGLPGGDGPLFVTGIDAASGAVIAGDRSDCESTRVLAIDPVWSGPSERRVFVSVRARSAAVPATVVRSGRSLEITLDEPVCAAPGQAAVCYDGDVIVGGGTIVRGRLG